MKRNQFKGDFRLKFFIFHLTFLIAVLNGCANVSEVRRGEVNTPTVRMLFSFGSTGSESGFFIRPTGIVMDLEGFLYVSDTGNSRIQKFSADGVYVVEFGAFGGEDDRLSYPTALATNGISLYVADERNERVVQYNRYGTFEGILLSSSSVISASGRTGRTATSNELGRIFPRGISISKGNEIFVSDREGDRVIVTDLSGRIRRTFGEAGGRIGDLLDPLGIVVDGEGQVYVSDTGNGRIHIFDSFGGPIRVYSKDISHPKGVAIDHWGNLFVTEEDGIRIFDRHGNPVPQSLLLKGDPEGFGGNLESPTGIFITRGNRLYVCDTGNDRVVVYQLTYNEKIGE
jgi:DNA-binding beta-propeller fold protein YncE